MLNPRPTLDALPTRFDLIVIGGGITGAGILREAVGRGASVLLVERSDFASGTSSASSKLVHGGLRYLAHGNWRLTLESVRERNRLLAARNGLVSRLPFLMPIYAGMRPGRATMRAGLAIYDLMGGQWRSRSLSGAQAVALEPRIRREGLQGAVLYDDAQTDDARLTLSLIFEAVAAGATALNYVAVEGLLQGAGGVRGVALRDSLDGATREIEAEVVVNAAGPWAADAVCAQPGAPELRPLRGSHLIFAAGSLPVRQAVSWLHPRDRRPIFVYPWQGIVLFGTTDIDHVGSPESARISTEEVDYLFEGLAHQFPGTALGRSDVISSYAGVRPIVAGGKSDPSAESRESTLWSQPGYLGITGGKLTTFGVTARQVLAAAAHQHPGLRLAASQGELPRAANALAARYGDDFEGWQAGAVPPGGDESVGGSPYCWNELRWAARRERVVHLDDLLLRRTRLGLLLPEGGTAQFDRLAALCGEELDWNESRWQVESARYRDLWQRQHALAP